MINRISYLGICLFVLLLVTILVHNTISEINMSIPMDLTESELSWLATRYADENKITTLYTYDFDSRKLNIHEYLLGNGDVYLVDDLDRINRYLLVEGDDNLYNLFVLNDYHLGYIDSFGLPEIDLVNYDVYIRGHYIIYRDMNDNVIQFDTDSHLMEVGSVWPRHRTGSGNEITINENDNKFIISIMSKDKVLGTLTVGEGCTYSGYDDIFWAGEDYCCFIFPRKDNGRSEILIYSIEQETFVFKEYLSRVFEKAVGKLYPSIDGKYFAYMRQEGFKSNYSSINIYSFLDNKSYLIYEPGEDEFLHVQNILWTPTLSGSETRYDH